MLAVLVLLMCVFIYCFTIREGLTASEQDGDIMYIRQKISDASTALDNVDKMDTRITDLESKITDLDNKMKLIHVK